MSLTRKVLRLAAFIIGVSSLCYVVWDCYSFFRFSSGNGGISVILAILLPAAILLLMTWRKEILHWTHVVALFLAVCTGLTLIDSEFGSLGPLSSWTQFFLSGVGFTISSIFKGFITFFVFHGSLLFLNSLVRKNRNFNAQQDAPSNGGQRSNLNSGFPPRRG